MSSIDLVILGMLSEKPQSAYDLQKDVDDHHFARWTKISTPSIYRKVLQLREKGYIRGQSVPGDRFAEKTVYSITDSGRAYFERLMHTCAAQPVPLLFDFNVVIANLNKMERPQALDLIARLRESISASARSTRDNAERYPDIPLVGKTIFAQQELLYHSLLEWLNSFEFQFRRE